MPNAKCQMLNAICKMLNAKCQMLNGYCLMPNDLLLGPWLVFFVWKIEASTTVHPWFVYVLKILFLMLLILLTTHCWYSKSFGI